MALEFKIPFNLRDVEMEPEDDSLLYVKQAMDISVMTNEEVMAQIEELSFELSEKEVLCIKEEEIFSRAYSLIRDFELLTPSAKSRLVDMLATNLSCLAPSIELVISAYLREGSGNDGSITSHMRSHRNALKIYTFLLYYLIVAAEGEPVLHDERPGKTPRKGKKKHLPARWDWTVQRLQVLRPMASVLERDLKQLYQGAQPEDSFIGLFTKIAFTFLENPDAVKEGDLKAEVFRIVISCATNYGCLEATAASVVDLLHKQERLASVLAEMVSQGERTLAAEVIRQVGRTHPKVFVRDTTGARSVGEFLVSLAERQPKVVEKHLSILMPYLNEEPYIIRNALVSIMGITIAKVFSQKDVDGSVDTENSRIRNKDSLLSHLLQQVRDTSAYTRSKVLQTWAYLCEEKAIPLSHWNEVTQLAIGRLEDKAASVRKSALQLLSILMQMNPFGSDFVTSSIEKSLAVFEKKFEAMKPSGSQENVSGTPVPNDEEGKEVPFAENGGPEDMSENEGDKEMANTKKPECTTSSLDNDTSTVCDASKNDEDSEQNDSGPSQEHSSRPQQDSNSEFTLSQIRTLIASLKTFLNYCRQMEEAISTVVQLLASPSKTDVEQAIQLLTLAYQFHVNGAEQGLRKMLPLVFSQDASIKEAVESAVITLYMQDSPTKIAQNLVTLTLGASLGDLTAMEALLCGFMHRRIISQDVMAALWEYFKFNQPRVTPAHSRGALVILTMAAKANPDIMSMHLSALLVIGFGARAKEDALLARYTCIALQRLPESDRQNMRGNHKVFTALSDILTESPLPDTSWYTAAEQAIKAIYSLHVTPEVYASFILQKYARKLFSQWVKPSKVPNSKKDTESDTFPGSSQSPEQAHEACLEENTNVEGTMEENSPSLHKVSPTQGSVSAYQVSRFLFIVGQVALQHLVYIEDLVKKLRKAQAQKERAASERLEKGEANEDTGSPDKGGGINAELGVTASLDTELDIMLEQSEHEICSRTKAGKVHLIGATAPFVVRVCKHASLLQQSPALRCSAILALCKLMAIDADFCESNLQLLFTVVQNASTEMVRSNAVIALGDLAFRFPNLVEPWTEHVYRRLHDDSPVVRKNTVMVLSHLILNDMMKVKGHISELALKVVDEDQRISDLARLFFNELAKKGSNPIYNLLPDILSGLSTADTVPEETLRSVMQFLIGLIQKEKQNEGLIEKLSNRFIGTTDVRQWRNTAFCLSLLTFSDKGMKRIMDNMQEYKAAIVDKEVMEHFSAILAKAKKFAKPELKVVIEEFEEKLNQCHVEQKEDEEAAAKAHEHKLRKEKLKEQMEGSHESPSELTPTDVSERILEANDTTSESSKSPEEEQQGDPDGFKIISEEPSSETGTNEGELELSASVPNSPIESTMDAGNTSTSNDRRPDDNEELEGNELSTGKTEEDLKIDDSNPKEKKGKKPEARRKLAGRNNTTIPADLKSRKTSASSKQKVKGSLDEDMALTTLPNGCTASPKKVLRIRHTR